MKPELKAKWIATLRSGNYKQANGVLRDDENNCCCLGVLCDIVQPNGWSNETSTCYEHGGHSFIFPGTKFLSKVGLTEEEARKAAQLNDKGAPFEEIADWIEANL